MQAITQLQIRNYKSIEQVDLSCSRINVLVGEPNVGKSNILEALDLSFLSWIFSMNESFQKEGHRQIDLKDYFRVEKVADLYHLGNVARPILISHPGFSYDVKVMLAKINGKSIFEWTSGGQITAFDNDFVPVEGSHFYSSPIQPYRYSDNTELHDTGNYLDHLMPPFGNNWVKMLKWNPSFREFVNDLIQDYGFELNIDSVSAKILIQFRVGKGLVYSVPYEAMADTLRRFIFYIAAIRHGNAPVITLEEPEVHSFPKYISYLADEMIKARRSQFFVATHSPYLLNNLVENTPEGELAVFVCGYDKTRFETTVKKLSPEDLSELLNFGVDIFFNINRYVDDRSEHNP